MRGGGQRQRKRLLHNGGAERLIPKAGQGSTGQGWPARRTGDGNGAAAAAASSEQCACTSAQNRVALASLHLGSNTCRRRGCWFALVWFAWLLLQSQSQSQVAVAVGVGVRIGSGGAGLGRLCLICPIISPVCSVPPAVIPSCTLHSALCTLRLASQQPSCPPRRLASPASSHRTWSHPSSHPPTVLPICPHTHLQTHTHAHIYAHIYALSLLHTRSCAHTPTLTPRTHPSPSTRPAPRD